MIAFPSFHSLIRLAAVLTAVSVLTPHLFAGEAPLPAEPFDRSCRPAPAPMPEGFDPERIYMASRPSLLPDGKSFLFEWCDAIWQAPTAGGVAKVLQHSSGHDAWPVVSRDGRRFAFQSSRAGGWHLFVADIAEGAEARQVAFNSEAERPFQWSVDDSSLLCVVMRDNMGSFFDQARIALVPVDKRAAETMLFDAPGSEPCLSPDGRFVLFTQEGEELYRKGFTGENASRIWCYDVQNKSFTLAVKHPTESRTPLWTPDGSGFYYVSGQDGTQNIWWHAFPGSEERKLTSFSGDSVIHPTLSADGQTMVFRQGLDFWSFNPTTPDVAPKKIALTPEDAGLVRVTTRRRKYDTLWNNDATGCLSATSGGMEFAFTTGGDLYVMDTVLKDPRRVYGDSRTHERDCVFSKDGSKLFFFSDRGDSVALLVAEKANPERFWWENAEFRIKPLIEDSTRREGLSISPGGDRLAWLETESVLTVADTEGKVIRRFDKVKGVDGYDWSPDGRWLVASISDDYSNSDIWILSIDDPERKPYNLSRSFTWDGNPVWSPDGKVIAWSGQRTGSGAHLFHVWLCRKDEEALRAQDYRKAIESMGLQMKDRKEEANILGAPDVAEPAPEKEKDDQPTPPPEVQIDFEDLHERVRATPIHGLGAPFFSPDSQKLYFPATLNGRPGTYSASLTKEIKPTFYKDRWGASVGWFGKDKDPKRADRLVMITNDRKIGTFDETFPFCVYQELNVRDYQELGFLIVWGTMRDMYYDPAFHGVDWLAVKAKYQAPARFAPCRTVYERIMHSMNGELNSSHLGFYADDNYRKEWEHSRTEQSWEPITSHLGIIFDPNYRGSEGWMVERVIPEGPADTAQIGLKPGDLVLSIDGTPIRNGMDPTLLLNGPRLGKFFVEVRSGDATRKVYIESVSYATARTLVQKEMYRNRQNYVHQRSGGALGYINIARMNNDEYNRFEREVFAEGFGKEGMVIDVRDNVGGFTADRVLNILGVQRHSWSVARHGNPAYLAGYWGRPVFDKPIVVLCNQNTVSNGEIFSHAIKQLGRGKLVGVQTNGGVIATGERKVLDLGSFRCAHYGWYTLDGTDMELHGAVPDVTVDLTPADTAAGRDPQLDAAIDVLLRDVEAFQRNNKPFSPKTFKSEHHL